MGILVSELCKQTPWGGGAAAPPQEKGSSDLQRVHLFFFLLGRHCDAFAIPPTQPWTTRAITKKKNSIYLTTKDRFPDQSTTSQQSTKGDVMLARELCKYTPVGGGRSPPGMGRVISDLGPRLRPTTETASYSLFLSSSSLPHF